MEKTKLTKVQRAQLRRYEASLLSSIEEQEKALAEIKDYLFGEGGNVSVPELILVGGAGDMAALAAKAAASAQALAAYNAFVMGLLLGKKTE